ncbi:ATP-binding cassette domain-containing protein [Micromonospora sp. NPDC047730]|uniref:ATP-binding cassette domain-containing protein n=1 Tax=Micromonospora sp. NPDC047730 TaxID=3364253 RepID=UPI00370F85FF
MIEVRELSKRYGKTVAVDRLTFDVTPGHVTGFLGPNGAGKSTTMRMVLGLDRPSHGDIRIDGKRYVDLAEPLRHVGALLNAKDAQDARTAYDHLLAIAQTNRISRHRVDEVLAIVGLTDVAGRRIAGFSLGMSQRLGIAVALLGDPPILMFDEPVNGLDPEGILWIRNLMKGLAHEGRTVFVSSHLMSEMAITADHLIVIGRGKLLADTTMAEFIKVNARGVVRIRSAAQDRLVSLMRAEGMEVVAHPDGLIETDEQHTARVGQLAADDAIPLLELSPQRPSLEEAFMRMTANAVEFSAAPPVGRLAERARQLAGSSRDEGR